MMAQADMDARLLELLKILREAANLFEELEISARRNVVEYADMRAETNRFADGISRSLMRTEK